MSRWPLIPDETPVKCLSEENRSGLATKTGLFALMMTIHSSLFLIKVNQMVKRTVLWVPRLQKSSLRWSLMQKNTMFSLITFLPLYPCLKSWKTCHYQPEMAQKNHGFMSVCSTNDVCLVHWVDNTVVTVASNHLTHEPSQNCKRYSGAKKVRVDVT